MQRPTRHLLVERRGEVYCLRLANNTLSETDMIEMADEAVSLIIDRGYRKFAFALGPESPVCLYSIFLAKLVTIRRRLRECNGQMRLCHVPDNIRDVFKACRLDTYFEFEPDLDTAVAALSAA